MLPAHDEESEDSYWAVQGPLVNFAVKGVCMTTPAELFTELTVTVKVSFEARATDGVNVPTSVIAL
jgi:hypothetical protein